MGQLSEQQKDTLVRQLAVLLNVLDSDIKVQKIQAYSDIRYEDPAVPERLVIFFASLAAHN